MWTLLSLLLFFSLLFFFSTSTVTGFDITTTTTTTTISTATNSIVTTTTNNNNIGSSSSSSSTNHTTSSSNRPVTSRLYVHIPFSLHEREGSDHVRAEFGFPSVSSPRSLAEYVYYYDGSLCHPILNSTLFGYPTVIDRNRHTPFILLANSDSGCSSIIKARYAQEVGAIALLIADTHCRCHHKECVDKHVNDTCIHSDRPTLSGYANDITIPTFLIYKELADSLKHTMKDMNQPCLIELQWDLLPPETEIESFKPYFHFWTTAYDPLVTLETYVEWKSIAIALQDYAIFTPKFNIINGTLFNCAGNSSNTCDHLCTSNGRYCSLHAIDLSGHAIIEETLRRLCISKHYVLQKDGHTGAIKYNALVYWDYAIYHKEECSTNLHMFTDTGCIDAAYKKAKIDKKLINECMIDSGDLNIDTVNTVLEEEIESLHGLGITIMPAVTVNNKHIYNPTPHTVFDTLCTEYWLNTNIKQIPKICEQCSACPNSIGCIINNGHCIEYKNQQRFPNTGNDTYKPKNNKKKGRHHGWKVFGWMVFLGGLAGAAFYVYDKYYRDRFFINSSQRGTTTALMSDTTYWEE